MGYKSQSRRPERKTVVSILAQVRVVIVMMEKRGWIRPVFVVAADRTLGWVGNKKEEGVKDDTRVWVVGNSG